MRIVVAGIMVAVAAAAPGSPAGKPSETPAGGAGASGAAELLNAVLPNGWCLFDAGQRVALDEVNRQWREADSQAKKAADPAAKEQAVGRRQAAEKRLVELLAACSSLVDVKVERQRAAASRADGVALPGDVGVLLLRVRTRPGEMRVVTAAYDLSQSRDPIPIAIAAEGDTWAVIRLGNAPAGRSSLVVHLDRPNGPSIPLIVTVQAPELAHIRVSAVSEKTGRPVPVMVSLVWKTDGQDRRPSSAVDFSGQFDGLGRVSAGRAATLPGRLKGRLWWCVPGPFDMPIPPGEWDLIIRHGLECVPIFETFSAKPGQSLELTYKLRQWADMPGQGWYSGDDHVHCQMISDADAGRLMAWAQAEDVHVVNVLKMSDVYRTWFQQRGFGPSSRVKEGDYVLVPGQECPRTHSDGFGHTISLNTPSYVRDVDRYWLYDWVADEVHRQGGLFGFAHAYLTHPYIRRGSSLIAPRPRIDFAEILQVAQMGTDFYYDWLNLGYKMAVSAGTDVPWQGSIGEVRMYAYLGDQPFSADAWFEALKRGQTFVTNGPMLDLHVDDALPGDEIAVERPRKLRVRCRAWGVGGYMVPARLEIIRHGEAIKSVESTDALRDELSVDFEIDSGDGFWLAARATGSDGSLAHTTPVYVVRKPLRFWKIDTVESLIAQRLANLDDIEQLIAHARQAVDQGKADDNVTAQTMARQAPELLKRVGDARRFFQQLRGVAEHEKALRARPR
jgi:hypothetical protein